MSLGLILEIKNFLKLVNSWDVFQTFYMIMKNCKYYIKMAINELATITLLFALVSLLVVVAGGEISEFTKKLWR